MIMRQFASVQDKSESIKDFLQLSDCVSELACRTNWSWCKAEYREKSLLLLDNCISHSAGMNFRETRNPWMQQRESNSVWRQCSFDLWCYVEMWVSVFSAYSVRQRKLNIEHWWHQYRMHDRQTHLYAVTQSFMVLQSIYDGLCII